MKLNYDFECYQPPKVTEKQLREILRQRQLARQTVLLVAASLLSYVCLGLLAFVVSPLSEEAGIACLVFLGISLANSGVIAVLLARKFSPPYRSISGNRVALEL